MTQRAHPVRSHARCARGGGGDGGGDPTHGRTVDCRLDAIRNERRLEPFEQPDPPFISEDPANDRHSGCWTSACHLPRCWGEIGGPITCRVVHVRLLLHGDCTVGSRRRRRKKEEERRRWDVNPQCISLHPPTHPPTHPVTHSHAHTHTHTPTPTPTHPHTHTHTERDAGSPVIEMYQMVMKEARRGHVEWRSNTQRRPVHTAHCTLHTAHCTLHTALTGVQWIRHDERRHPTDSSSHSKRESGQQRCIVDC
jgi:hypothetical protein